MNKDELELLMQTLYTLNIKILKLEFKDLTIIKEGVKPREVDITISLPDKLVKINNHPHDSI